MMMKVLVSLHSMKKILSCEQIMMLVMKDKEFEMCYQKVKYAKEYFGLLEGRLMKKGMMELKILIKQMKR